MPADVGLDEAVEELHGALQGDLHLAGAAHAQIPGQQQSGHQQHRHDDPRHHHRFRHRDTAEQRNGEHGVGPQLIHQGFLECIQTHHLVFAWTILLPPPAFG